MKISITHDDWEDYITWSNKRTILKRTNRMIEEAARDPAPGIGTPERLSHSLSGQWSRRITDEHRLDDQLRDNELIIVQTDTSTGRLLALGASRWLAVLPHRGAHQPCVPPRDRARSVHGV